MKELEKDKDATLDYGVNWIPFLQGTDSDTIVTAEWVNVHADLTVDDRGFANDLHLAMISGGQKGRAYRMTSRITTTQGRITDTSFILVITEN